MNKVDKGELWLGFGICLILAIAIKIVYLSQLGDERLKHTATGPFLPVVATMHTYQEYEVVERETDDDGYTTEYRTIKYNITYSYIVNDTTYYITEYDKTSLVDTIGIYYNPRNPNQTSYYATYEEAVEGLKISKIIGDVFIVLSIIIGLVSIYRTFLYKPPGELGGVVIKDDFKAFVESNQYYDNDSYKQEKMLKDYGVVATNDLKHISNVRPSVVMPESENKSTVDKVETIAFPGKISTDTKFDLYTEQEYEDMMDKES